MIKKSVGRKSVVNEASGQVGISGAFWQELEEELKRLRKEGLIDNSKPIEVGHKVYYGSGISRHYEYSEHEYVVEYQIDPVESFEALLQRRYNSILRALDCPPISDAPRIGDDGFVNQQIHQEINRHIRDHCKRLSNRASSIKTTLKICCNDEVLKRIRYDLYCGRLVIPRPHSIELALRNTLIQSKLAVGKRPLAIQDCNVPLISSITRKGFLNNIHQQLNQLVTLVGIEQKYDCSKTIQRMSSMILRYCQLPILDIRLEATRKRKSLYIKRFASPGNNDKEYKNRHKASIKRIEDRLDQTSKHLTNRLDEVKRIVSMEPILITDTMQYIERVYANENTLQRIQLQLDNVSQTINLLTERISESVEIMSKRTGNPAAVVLEIEQPVQ